jgi:ATP-dependent RNA/DNA helicase IGHMBP2
VTILDADITGSAASAVNGISGSYERDSVCRDLARGWTLSGGRGFRETPEKLRLIGERFHYIAKLSGYRLPPGLCVCGHSPCRCRDAYRADNDPPGALILITARPREPGDYTEQDVLFGDRYHEPFRAGERLDPLAYSLLSERWTRVHARAQRPAPAKVKRWRELNQILAFLAAEESGTVRLATPPLDEDELAEGQLVLLAESAAEAERAAVNFVYRLPGLEMALRVEDRDENRLLVDCGEQDPARVHEHLKRLPPRDLRLSKDERGTAAQIERARWALDDAARDPKLAALIQQPAIALRTARRRAGTLFNEDLDEGQRAALDAALAAEDVLIVQGPPGTGKTTFICETVRQLLARDPHVSVLLAAQTHQAIDNVLMRLARADPDLAMARVGSPFVAARMDPFVRERYWIESPEPWVPRVRLRAEAFRRMAQARLRAGDIQDEEELLEILAIQDEYFISDGAQRGPLARLQAARVVAGTCFAVSANPAVRARSFSVALLEEAGKATPPEALMLMLRSRKSILIGDSRQLPPHVWGVLSDALRNPSTITSSDPELAEKATRLAAAARGLGASAEDRVRSAEETLFEHFATHLHGSEHETTLSTQYRMVPAIGELVSDVFYGGGLRHGRPADLSDRDPRVSSFAGAAQVRLLDIPGRQRRERPGSKSNLRDGEIDCIRDQLAGLQQHAAQIGPPRRRPGPLGVAVITPYAAQARRLQARLELERYPDLHVRIGIVDRFQGDEDCVVIVSFVNTTYAGFLKVPNRVNVALSRAKDLLIITTDLRAAETGRIGEPLKNVAGFIAERARSNDSCYEIIRPPDLSPSA